MFSLIFSAGVEWANHTGLLYKLESLGVGEVFSPSFVNFCRVDHNPLQWMVACSQVLGMYQGQLKGASVIDPLLFLLYTADFVVVVESSLLVYSMML